jgi:hypothetical protein
VNLETVVGDESSIALITLVLLAEMFLHVVLELNLSVELLATHLTDLLLLLMEHHVTLDTQTDRERMVNTYMN